MTPTGQVSTSLNSLTVEAIARRDAAKLMANAQAIADQGSLAQWQSQVRADVRRLAGVGADEKQMPKVTSSPLKQADGYRTESLKIESEPGIVLHGVLGSPATVGTHPAIVWMDPTPVEAISRSPEFIRLVRAGECRRGVSSPRRTRGAAERPRAVGTGAVHAGTAASGRGGQDDRRDAH